MKYGSMERHVALQVHLTWRAIRKTLLETVQKGPRSVSRGSYSIPILIELNPGVSPAQLAAALRLDASKVAFFLRELESEGHIERKQSVGDRRVVELYLTPAGRKFAREALDASRELEAPFEGALSEDERDTLIRLLVRFERAAECAR